MRTRLYASCQALSHYLAKMMRNLSASLVVGIILAAGGESVHAANKSKLSAYAHDQPVEYLPCGTSPLLTRTAVLMGGGIDVQEALAWMITKMSECRDGSTGRPGNFLVIRAGGNPSYDSLIYKLGPVASVQTIVVPNADVANDPAIEPYIRNAGAIWLTGGDQGDYYNFWHNSLLERLVSEHVKNYGVPIGGTSAGMMILSEFNYIAYPYTINSTDALNDPFKDGAVTLKRDFWTYRTPFPPLLQTVTDSHFDTRDHMGRLITFLAHIVGDKWASNTAARAIGVDQETALLMEYDGDATQASQALASSKVRAVSNPGINGAGYVLSVGTGSKLILVPGQPLTFSNIEVHKIPASGQASNYQINVEDGVMTSSTRNIY